jgi:nucleoside 2-deoxyribosyltransferase
MKPLETVYLAGFEAFLPDATSHDLQRLALASEAGLKVLIPAFDPGDDAPEVAARMIYADRAALMRRADAGIVNLTPWRGPACDPGVAFEAGFLAALGKPVFAFMNIAGEDEAEYGARVEAWFGAEREADGVLRDAYGSLVEDLGLPESVMLWAEARRLFLIATEDPLTDLTGLQLCFEAVKAYGAL